MKIFDIFSTDPSCHQGTFLFAELIGWFEMCYVPTWRVVVIAECSSSNFTKIKSWRIHTIHAITRVKGHITQQGHLRALRGPGDH